MRLILFDIDGTLVHTRGVGKRALSRALDEVLHTKGALENVNLSGRTDPSLIREVCLANQIPFQTKTKEVVLERYLQYLQKNIEEEQQKDQWILPGAHALLSSLEKKSCLGLATGNVEGGARLKLGAVLLEKFFPIGGFGCDAEERDKLVSRGVEKAKNYYQEKTFSKIVIVGDTPLDIFAAHQNNFLAVGVASGMFDQKALEKAGANAVLGSLEDDFAEETILSVTMR